MFDIDITCELHGNTMDIISVSITGHSKTPAVFVRCKDCEGNEDKVKELE